MVWPRWLANYNVSYVPYNASYPTVAIGLSLPLVPDSVVQGADDFLAFTVDLTNFRGGVSVLGPAALPVSDVHH